MEKQEEGGEWSKESALNHCCSIFVFYVVWNVNILGLVFAKNWIFLVSVHFELNRAEI